MHTCFMIKFIRHKGSASTIQTVQSILQNKRPCLICWSWYWSWSVLLQLVLSTTLLYTLQSWCIHTDVVVKVGVDVSSSLQQALERLDVVVLNRRHHGRVRHVTRWRHRRAEPSVSPSCSALSQQPCNHGTSSYSQRGNNCRHQTSLPVSCCPLVTQFEYTPLCQIRAATCRVTFSRRLFLQGGHYVKTSSIQRITSAGPSCGHIQSNPMWINGRWYSSLPVSFTTSHSHTNWSTSGSS